MADYSKRPEKHQKQRPSVRNSVRGSLRVNTDHSGRQRRGGFCLAPMGAPAEPAPLAEQLGSHIHGGEKFARELRMMTVEQNRNAERRVVKKHLNKEMHAHRYFGKMFHKHGLDRDTLASGPHFLPPPPGSPSAFGGYTPLSSAKSRQGSLRVDAETLDSFTVDSLRSPAAASIQSRRSLWSYVPEGPGGIEVHHRELSASVLLPPGSAGRGRSRGGGGGGGGGVDSDFDEETCTSELTAEDMPGSLTFLTAAVGPEEVQGGGSVPITLSWPLDLGKEDKRVLREMNSSPPRTGEGIRITTPLSLHGTPSLSANPRRRNSLNSMGVEEQEDEKDIAPKLDRWQQQWMDQLKPKRVDKLAQLLDPTDEQIQKNNAYSAKHARMMEVLNNKRMQAALGEGKAAPADKGAL